LRGYGGQISRVKLRHVETDCTVPEQLAALGPAAQDVVLCLATDLAESDAEADARTLVAYEILQGLKDAGHGGKQPRLVLELLDELNVALIDPERCEYLLSPRVLSHMLGQVALRRELNSVFEQLFNSGRTEITFRNVLRYGAGAGRRVSFAELQVLARTHHEVALGYFSAEGACGLMLNPGPAAEWTVAPGDRVVVLRN
jgi:ion channel POLLUX/CASTOR